MTFKQFIIEFLRLISLDCGFGFLLYLLWKYLDLKYFSSFEIETLKRENEYLRLQNPSFSDDNSFWGGDKNDS